MDRNETRGEDQRKTKAEELRIDGLDEVESTRKNILHANSYDEWTDLLHIAISTRPITLTDKPTSIGLTDHF